MSILNLIELSRIVSLMSGLSATPDAAYSSEIGSVLQNRCQTHKTSNIKGMDLAVTAGLSLWTPVEPPSKIC